VPTDGVVVDDQDLDIGRHASNGTG
jgi:hypothetical protein